MLSHNNKREFKPEKIFKPRNFELAENIDLENVVLEIGAGKGKHALDFAQNNPHRQIIAIERTKNKFTAFQKAHDALDIDNLILVNADAIAWTVYALPPKCIDTCYILYPNPEPRNPNQQWINMPYFEFLLSRMQTGGRIIIASNLWWYIDHVYQKSIETWHLSTTLKVISRSSQRTHFEKKYIARGEKCWQVDIIKPKDYVTRFDDWQTHNAINHITYN